MRRLAPSRRAFLGNVAAGVVAMSAGAARAAASAGRPNVLFILADDLGFADLSCYGQPDFTTPVLDRLAAQGVRLTQAYANSAICSSTRTALVTGRYQHRFRVGLEEPIAASRGLKLPDGTPTIASRFRALGYRTALVGKWHVGAPPENGPTHYGYDHFWGFAGGAADYFKHRADLAGKDKADTLYDDDAPIERDGYLTDLLADEASRWIGQGGPKPFFLSLHFNAPHWPWEGPGDKAYSDALTELRDTSGGSLAKYAEMVRALDAAIGRVLATLRARGMENDTIVVFTSDNGGERYSDTWPLTGTKGELLEGGIRVPLIVRWPGHVRPGSVSPQVMISMDFAPTLLAAAGAPPLAADETDGVNLLPQLTGAAAPIARTLYWRFKASEQAALRDGDWKYLKLGGKEHLFNVAADPRERAELRTVHPETFARLKGQFADWNARMLPYPDGSFSETVKQYYPDRY